MNPDDLWHHCYTEHKLPWKFMPAPGVTWDMVHHLLHRLKGWGRP